MTDESTDGGRRMDKTGDDGLSSLVVVRPHTSCRTTRQRSRKDSGWSWIVMVASFALQAITVGVCLSSGLFVIEFMEVFGASHVQTTWIASMQIGVAYLIGAPISGPFCERFSHRASVVVGGIVMSIGILASTFATNVVFLYFMYGLVSGVGFGLIYSPSIGIIGQYFDMHLALALGIIMAGGGCGAMLFSQIFYLLIGFYGWRGALAVTSSLVLNSCVLGALLFPIDSSSKEENDDASRNVVEVRGLRNSLRQIPALLRDMHFVLFFVNSFLLCFGSTAIFILLVDYAIDCGVNPGLATVLLSVTGLLSTVGRFTMAGLMQCLRHSVRAIDLYGASTVSCGLAVLLMPSVKGFAGFVVTCSVFGFSYGGCCSASPVVATQFFGVERLTTVYGYTLIASGLGCLLGSPVTGWMFEKTRNYDMSIVFNGGSILLAFVSLVPIYFLSCHRWSVRLKVFRSIIIENSVSDGNKQPL